MKKCFSNFALLATLTIVYFYSGKLGLALAFVHPNATSVWPPAGIALAAVLLTGYQIWPAIFIGAFLVNFMTAVSLATSISIAAGNTLEALLGAFLVRRFAHGVKAFDRAEDCVKFVVLAGMVSTTVSAALGVSSLCLGGYARWDHFVAIAVTWWSGDMVSDLVVAPVVLIWFKKSFTRWQFASIVEAVSLLLVLFFVGQIIFGGWAVNSELRYYLQEFLCVPPILWAAFRFGYHGAATASLLMSSLAIWGTLNGFGPFASRDVIAITNSADALVLLQLFMGSLALTALIVASVLEQRRRVEEQFQLAVESAPNAMVMANHKGLIVLVNKQAEKLFGYARSELLDQSIDALVPARFRQRHGEYRGSFLNQPSSRPMGAGRDLYGLRRDGSEVPIEIGLNPVPSELGFTVLASIVDITERKRTDEELRQSEEKFRLIAETQPDIFFTHRPNGWCEYANQRFYDYTGMAIGSAMGLGWTTALHPDDVERTESKWRASVQAGQPFEFKFRLRSVDEQYKWFVGRSQPLLESLGRSSKWFCVWTDIDRLMRAEDVLRASAQRYRKVAKQREEQLIVSDRLVSVGELVPSLAHEFNNPLQIITGFTQHLLSETRTTDKQHQSLRIIAEAAERCKKTISELLDFARPTPAIKRPTRIAQVARKSIDLIANHLRKNGVETRFEIPESLPEIYADPRQVEQVLLNLFFNAVEAMPTGGVLTVRAELCPGDNKNNCEEKILITVSDTGMGIAPEVLPNIFRPFFTTKTGAGMGLGLSVCETIIKNLDGSIATESAKAGGTTFLISIPVLHDEEMLSPIENVSTTADNLSR